MIAFQTYSVGVTAVAVYTPTTPGPVQSIIDPDVIIKASENNSDSVYLSNSASVATGAAGGGYELEPGRMLYIEPARAEDVLGTLYCISDTAAQLVSIHRREHLK